MPSPDSIRRRDGDTRTAISDGMVALLKEYYGVGPSQAKTYYHDDLVVCPTATKTPSWPPSTRTS